MEKNQKQLISEHCQREKIPNPTYVCTPDKEKNPNGFFCTLSVGDQSFCTSNWQTTKKNAELEAAKLACEKLDLSRTNAELKQLKQNVSADNTTVKNAAGIVKDPDWITIEKVEDIYKYLTDEVLAQEFKAFLHCKAQEEKKDYPVFSVEDVEDKGYKGTVTYDGVQYHSLGVMLTKKQAEQSAAEVCLRTLGDFPNVEKDKYTIQVYRGGQVHQIYQPGKKSDTPRNLQHMMSGLLQLCVGNLSLQYPSYRYKEMATEEGTTYMAVVIFEGKKFESRTAHGTMVEAKEDAAEEALKYLGFNNPQEGHELRDRLRIRKRRPFNPIGVLMSPLLYCPSKRLSWIFHHFEALDEMTGEAVTLKNDTQKLLHIKVVLPQTNDEVFARALAAEPSIEGTTLCAREDISVGEVNSENKSLMIIGNNECSIRMFCEDGKIMCNNRSCKVDLLSGHNIRGLKCTYQMMYPSLQVYLKAESCDDLMYPNPPLPVVTSVGMAMLMYDHEATAQDLHILLSRPADHKTFVTKSKYLASYLNKQFSTTGVALPSKFNVAECVSNIKTWTHKEVQLMSEMTMESMHELMSLYVRYDERWNEIFVKEHTDVLKELKAEAVAELERRTEEGEEEYVNNTPWVLPSGPFNHRLLATGAFVENNIQCAFRSVLQTTGLKVKFSDIEESPIIDVPLKDNPNNHRGDVCRYYVWKGLRKVSGTDDEPYYKPAEVTKTLGEGWNVDADYENKKKRKQGKDKFRQKRKMQDNQVSENVEAKKENGDAPQAMEEDKKPVTDERPERPERQIPETPKSTKSVLEECRWFPLEEAKKLSPALAAMAKNPKFKNQVKALQLEANAFMKEKASTE